MTISAGASFKLFDQDLFIIYRKKAIYWKQQQALIVADVHLGKNRAFQKKPG